MAKRRGTKSTEKVRRPRQSAPERPVMEITEDTEQTSSPTAYWIGSRIRGAMARLGWVDDAGNPDVRRFAEAVGASALCTKPPRWQTVQYWVRGESVPGARYGYAAAVASVLGMTLEELLGVAVGQDPPFPVWHDFLATALGQSMTPEERRSLQAFPWPPAKEPTVAAYQILLQGLRAAEG